MGGGLCLSALLLIIYVISLFYYERNLKREMSFAESNKTQEEFLFEVINPLLEKSDLAKEFYEELINSSVLLLLEDLSFRHDPSIRISLYSHSGDSFTLLFRYSDDPSFKKKGRAVYPDNEGVIGEAYHRNSCAIANLPCPEINLEDWQKAQLDPNRGRMKKMETIHNLTMKSRSLIALPIRHGDDKHVIVVFESISPEKFALKEIEKALSGPLGEKLKKVLSRYKACIEPSISIAEKMRL